MGGAAGAGKTTLAAALARGLGLPLVAKDRIKEALMDVLGSPDVEASRRIGRATYAVLYAMAHAIVDAGSGVVLESNFDRERSAEPLRALAARGGAVFVHCDVDATLARERYASRSRHPGHHDGELLAQWDLDVTRHAPPEGIHSLRVDTSAPVDARALARAIRELA